MSDYKPPFEMTETIANLTAEIAELAGEISVYEEHFAFYGIH
jgi:hypothetical protein